MTTPPVVLVLVQAIISPLDSPLRLGSTCIFSAMGDGVCCSPSSAAMGDALRLFGLPVWWSCGA